MNRLSIEDRARILAVLSEGGGVNAACRITGAAKGTVLKLIAGIGSACAAYQDRVFRDLTPKRLQIDEIWSFVGAKEKHVPRGTDPELHLGDCYTFTSLDQDTKLIPCWLVGQRNTYCTHEFIQDLSTRIVAGHRFQITTDAWKAYPPAIARYFEAADYAVLHKNYEAGYPQVEAKRRYSPASVVSVRKEVVAGLPDLAHVTTSHVERANLSIRMSNRRLTRLTNAFSKKFENHMHAMSFFFMVYNFVKVHGSLRVSPAMGAGITDTLWTIEDIVAMADTMA
jgi:IS1 family transposase